MQQPATPIDLTLNEVKLHFEHWRATRAKRGKIPDSLYWQSFETDDQTLENTQPTVIILNNP